MFIEVHILQSFAPSNLNRDDTGNPKDTEFGGVRRARISSQCIKRSIRFHPAFSLATQVEPGVRTRWITRLLAKPLVDSGKDPALVQAVAEAFAIQYSKMDRGRTSVLLYLSNSEIQQAVNGLLHAWDEIITSLDKSKSTLIEALAKDLFKRMKNRTSSPDIALFGRMLAEKPELNVDAACQVAHAISTHRVNMEMDFYTAVDDLSSQEETGAGMMGVIPFNSACFYRYARLDWDQLVNNLFGEVEIARRTVEGFLRAAVLAVPTGKQTGFGAQNPPDFVMAVVRHDGQSWSLTNAFEKPVRQEREGGLVAPSIAALDSYWGNIQRVYGNNNIKTVAFVTNKESPLDSLKETIVASMEDWVQVVLSELPKE